MKRIARSAAFLVMVAGGTAAAADLPRPSYYTATAPLSASGRIFRSETIAMLHALPVDG